MPDDLSDEDRKLFRQAVQNITPLKSKDKTAITRSRIDPQSIQLSSYYTREVQSESILAFHVSSFPLKRFRDLKAGKIHYEAKIDLHGFKQDGAQYELVAFIQQAYAANQRCVLVIHGKGGLRNEAPVLKNLVNHWLPQIPLVLAFCSALPKDGGNGALYVLLKKFK